jgi:BTB/POZ domain-containing protein 9
MKAVLSRDSFCAPEIEIFKAVKRWAEQNSDADLPYVMSAIRLPLMSLEELLNVVRTSGLVSADVILDGINIKTTKRDTDLCYRGSLNQSFIVLLSLGLILL